MTDGRSHRPQLTAVWREDGAVRAPKVGLWRSPPAAGTLVRPGDEIGELEILGVLHRLVAPAHAVGLVLEDEHPRRAPLAVDFGMVLFRLDPDAASGVAATSAVADATTTSAGALVFRSPLSGRFYLRPAPDKPAFVSVGDEISEGQTVALIEVMKTFNRLSYGGDGLPARARIKAILPDNETDLDPGTPILELEPV